MYSQTSFETLLAFGNVAENIDLDYYGLEVNHLAPEEWNQLGMLQKRPIDKFVRCRGCGAFIPISIRDSGDEIQLCADCPECGPYELLPEEKAVWRVDFTPVFESARKALNCAGMVNEIVSNALWSLGRAPVSGQSREIFACAGINTERNSEILGHLPKGKTPILLVLGDSPLPCKLGSFPSDQVFCFSQLERIEDGKIVFETSCLHSQGMTPTVSGTSSRKLSSGKNSKIGDVIICAEFIQSSHKQNVPERRLVLPGFAKMSWRQQPMSVPSWLTEP